MLEQILNELENQNDYDARNMIFNIKDVETKNSPHLALKIAEFAKKYVQDGDGAVEAVKAMAMVAAHKPDLLVKARALLEEYVGDDLFNISETIRLVTSSQPDRLEATINVLEKYIWSTDANVVSVCIKHLRDSGLALYSTLKLLYEYADKPVSYVAQSITQTEIQNAPEVFVDLCDFYDKHIDKDLEAISESIYLALNNAPQNIDKSHDTSSVGKLIEFYEENIDFKYINDVAKVLIESANPIKSIRKQFGNELVRFLERVKNAKDVFEQYSNEGAYQVVCALRYTRDRFYFSKLLTHPETIETLESVGLGVEIAKISNKIHNLNEVVEVVKILKKTPKAAKVCVAAFESSPIQGLVGFFEKHSSNKNLDTILECMGDKVNRINNGNFLSTMFAALRDNMALFDNYSGDSVYEFANSVMQNCTFSNNLDKIINNMEKFCSSDVIGCVKSYEGKLEKGVVGNSLGKILFDLEGPYEDIQKHVMKVLCKYASKKNPNEALLPLYSISGHGAMVMERVANVLDKYYDNHSDVVAEVLKEVDKDFYIGEFMSTRAYNELKNSRDPKKTVEQIMENPYGDVIKWIKDSDVFDKIGYNDLKKIKSTVDFVMQVHSARANSQLNIIEYGFYEQLNRAVEQNSDYKDKIRSVRQYCNEVRDRVEDEAPELMVMTE